MTKKKETTFREAIKIWREANGFSQPQAAAFLEVSLRTYEGWEAGRQPIQVKTFLKLLGMVPPVTRHPPAKRG